MKHAQRIVCLLLVALVMMVGLLPTAALANETASCTESDVTFEVTLDYAFELLHVSQDVTVISWGHRVLGTVIVIEIEYYNGSGEVVLASGTYQLNSDCTPDFSNMVGGWDCNITVLQEEFDEVIDSGSGVVVILTFEEWKVTLGPLTITHSETDLWILYYEYVLSISGTITTSITTCTAPLPALSIRAWSVWGTGPYTWQYRANADEGWSDVELPNGETYHPEVEVRDRFNAATGETEADVQMVALVIPRQTGDVNLDNYRVIDATGQEVGVWLDINCEFGPTLGAACEYVDFRPENAPPTGG